LAVAPDFVLKLHPPWRALRAAMSAGFPTLIGLENPVTNGT
jgi:hypothetical protein